MRAIFVAALLTLSGCAGAFGERAHQTIHQAIASSAVPLVRVENVAGTVRIEGWHKSVVDVEATKYGYDADQLRNIEVEVRNEGSGVSIATNYLARTSNGGVRYKIFVPAGASLRVGNVAGMVDIAGVGGNVDVETQAGAIRADLGRVAGDRSIDLRATTGAIRVYVAPGSSARVDAASTVGAFSSDLPGISESRENLVGSRASGAIGAGSALIRMTTTTGAIALGERGL